MVYVANRDEDNNYANNATVSVISGNTNRVTANVTVGGSPSAISVNPTTNMVYLANTNNNTISIIDGKTNRIVSNGIQVGERPLALSVNPYNNIIYVANNNDTLSIISSN